MRQAQDAEQAATDQVRGVLNGMVAQVERQYEVQPPDSIAETQPLAAGGVKPCAKHRKRDYCM